jgi:hypothetical protein
MSLGDPQSTPFYRVTLEAGGSFVRVERTPRPYAEVGEIEAEAERIGAILDSVGRTDRGLLIDSRSGPTPSRDDAVERAHAKVREAVSRGFPRVAVLVGSAIGKLQVNRLVQGEGRGRMRAFDRVEEAEAYARGENGSESPARR